MTVSIERLKTGISLIIYTDKYYKCLFITYTPRLVLRMWVSNWKALPGQLSLRDGMVRVGVYFVLCQPRSALFVWQHCWPLESPTPAPTHYPPVHPYVWGSSQHYTTYPSPNKEVTHLTPRNWRSRPIACCWATPTGQMAAWRRQLDSHTQSTIQQINIHRNALKLMPAWWEVCFRFC